jgi:hypothetical protein
MDTQDHLGRGVAMSAGHLTGAMALRSAGMFAPLIARLERRFRRVLSQSASSRGLAICDCR